MISVFVKYHISVKISNMTKVVGTLYETKIFVTSCIDLLSPISYFINGIAFYYSMINFEMFCTKSEYVT